MILVCVLLNWNEPSKKNSSLCEVSGKKNNESFSLTNEVITEPVFLALS